MNAVPEPIPRETTDPENITATIEGDEIKAGAERVSQLQIIIGGIVLIFLAGVAGAAFLSRLATKSDLDAAMKAHAAAPSDPVLVHRIDGIDSRLGEHVAEHKSDRAATDAALRELNEGQREILRAVLRLPRTPR